MERVGGGWRMGGGVFIYVHTGLAGAAKQPTASSARTTKTNLFIFGERRVSFIVTVPVVAVRIAHCGPAAR